MKGKVDLSVVVPACDCLTTYKPRTAKLHRPRCKRMKAIRQKYGVE